MSWLHIYLIGKTSCVVWGSWWGDGKTQCDTCAKLYLKTVSFELPHQIYLARHFTNPDRGCAWSSAPLYRSETFSSVWDGRTTGLRVDNNNLCVNQHWDLHRESESGNDTVRLSSWPVSHRLRQHSTFQCMFWDLIWRFDFIRRGCDASYLAAFI